MDLPQACVPPGYHFRDVQLEMSLKPFWNATPETRDKVCREIFEQWRPLCRFAESISIMLWTGDGSEVLEYQGGSLDVELEWARYHGSANAVWVNKTEHDRAMRSNATSKKGKTDHSGSNIGGEADDLDPESRGVHKRSYLYRPEPAVFTLRWLKEFVAALKRIGREVTGKTIHVGTTFDIGPEFAVSKFKYEWHNEILGGAMLFGGKFIRCDATLKGDTRNYAGFPKGIPDGTTLGRFLGRQLALFTKEMAFDFVWFSNGFGFALEPWSLTGALFDGSAFKSDKAKATAAGIMKFWHDFRAECPALPVRTRGTNLTTGIDLGSDASPIDAIYKEAGPIDAPVNSPWAALDGDVGLELSGWMSHIAKLPRPGYRYRYYIHDPWWLNSPYLDRYQRQPFDIFLPLSVSRLRGDATVEPPSDLAFLSIDDSHGQLPVNVPIEVTSHILHAREFQPDAAGPLVWVYPFSEYNNLALGDQPNPSLPFFGDWFVRGLIAHGVPLNTVANSEDIRKLVRGDGKSIGGSVLVAPVIPERHELMQALINYAKDGGKVLFYGPLDDAPALRALLGVELAAPLEGDFEFTAKRTLRHLPFLSAGGWREIVSKKGALTATQKGEKRAVAVTLETGVGRIAWVRGSLATAEFDPENPAPIKGPRLSELDPAEFVTSEEITRTLLAQFGLTLEWKSGVPTNQSPMVAIHRHRNAFVFSGCQPQSEVSLQIGLPHGAPVFPGYPVRVKGGTATYHGAPSWHHVCRAFITQDEESLVTARIVPPIQHGYTERLLLTGLKNATVKFFPDPAFEKFEILTDPKFPYFVGNFLTPAVEHTPSGPMMTLPNITGEVIISW